MREKFLLALLRQVSVVWPILSTIVVAMAACGVAIGSLEGWRLDESLYFTFVTGLTIGYGDFAPKLLVARMLAIVVGFCGIVLTGLVAAVAVQALRAADETHAADMARRASPQERAGD